MLVLRPNRIGWTGASVVLTLALPTFVLAGPLQNGLSFLEIPVGQRTRTLPGDRKLIRVDINSTIGISFSTGALASLLFVESLDRGRPEDASEAEALKETIRGLEAWTDSLKQAWQGAQRLTRIPKTDPQYDEASRATNKGFLAFFKGFSKYEESLKSIPGGPERAAELRKNMNAALLQPSTEGQPKILRLFAAEIEFLNSRLLLFSKDVHARAVPLGIMMAAQLVGKDQKYSFHLPGYDKNVAGDPQPYEKLRLEPTPEDRKALAEIDREVSELANGLRDAKSLQDGLRVIGEKWLGEHFVRARKATSNLTALLSDLKSTDWRAKSSQVTAMAQADIEDLGSSRYQAILSSASAIASMKAQVVAALAKPLENLEGLQQEIAKIESATAHGSPDIAFVAALGLPAKLTKVAATLSDEAVSDLQTQATTLEKTLRTDIQNLSADVKKRLGRIVTATTEPETSRIQSAIEDFRQIASTLQQARDLIPPAVDGQLASALGTDLPAPAQELVPVNQASPTSINIMEAKSRQEGDRVRYRAWLYRMKRSGDTEKYETDGEPVDQVELNFEVTRFGFYSRPGGGVIFVSRMKTPTGGPAVHGQPAPSISWMVDHRKWPKDGSDGFSSSLWSTLRPSFGVHAATVRFQNAGGAEMGLGLTGSIMNDLLQVGYGWNINVPGRSDYWYVGFRLMHFGRGTGIKG